MMHLRFSHSFGLAVATIFALGLQSAQAFTVTPTGDATTLANTLVGSNSGLTIQNATYTGAANASGVFSNGGNIGIDSGIILTTGNAVGAVGPNSIASYTGDNGLGGDSQLTALAGGASTFDASTLAFNFTTDTGSISFSYIFASEEYPEFANQGFSDVFGFYINGSNIAFVPGTSSPVSIDTINAGINSSYYVSNSGASLNLISTQYDGLTTILTATISGLTIGVNNTLKLSIADVGDAAYDSAVFLQAGSLSSSATPPVIAVPEPSPLMATMALAAGFAGLLSFKRFRNRNIEA
jgi:hypothetical protein